MEAYMPLLIEAIAGAVGGAGLGALVKGKSLGTIGNLIAGVVGGLAAGQGLEYGGVLTQLTDMLGGNAMVSQGLAGLVGGGVLQLIAAQIVGKKAAAA